MRALSFVLALGLGAAGVATTGCKASVPRTVETPKAAPVDDSATCTALGTHVSRFVELVEDTEATGKTHLTSYAGVLEVLLSFERASRDLEAQIASMHAQGPAMKDSLAKASASLAEANEFARVEREHVEQRATVIIPLAKEADGAYVELRSVCEGKRVPKDCAGIKDILAKVDPGTYASASLTDDLAALRVTTPAASRARDRAVVATRALAKVLDTVPAEMAALTKKWSDVGKSLGATFQSFAAQCKNAPASEAPTFIADARPDPRKLTLLVRVKPPAAIDEAFEELASQAKDDDTRAFYQARARGAFGSGFVLVRPTANGGSETLVITNRHVVELADRAALELADGTSLGAAEIVYTDALHDVAVLRPSKKLPIEKGFAFSTAAAKDQQGVIATGFPGMAGRPSYQTTRGYVSNESFRMDDAAKPLVYVQHTAPIDPGSSGGPLTDERGYVLGVNTLKVTNREAVGLAVPAESILETIRRSDAAEAKRGSAQYRRESARLACLGFVAELASKKPRMLMLENMISNSLTSSEGLDAAMSIDDAEFGQIWQNDSVRAMRIAILVRLSNVMGASGGMSALETCNDANADDVANILTADEVRYRIRLANRDVREASFRYEQGHWKLGRMDLHAGRPTSIAEKLAPKVKPAITKRKKK